MASLVLGIVSLAAVGMSFAFSFHVFKVSREELAARATSEAKAAADFGVIATAADRALAEVGKLFVTNPRGVLANSDGPGHGDAEDEKKASTPEALPLRRKTLR